MSKERGWLYLPVEVKVRELDAKLLLTYYALKQGYRVIIGEHKMVELASTMYPKGIFFSKGYPRGFRKRVITNAKKHGHIVVELDEEGLHFNDTAQYLNTRMMEEMLHLVSQEYCWGNFQKQVITRAYPKSESKCYIVGNPRFDLLNRKFNGIYEKDAKKIQAEYGSFILINTRFSIYNSLRGKQLNPSYPINIYFKNLYDSFIEMIKALCEKYPNVHFVIRPHPGESLESYRSALSTYKNVHVVHEGNIIKWLMAASIIIHNGCTSSLEAFLLEKPIISYKPITSKIFDVELADQLGMKATTVLEVDKLLQVMLEKKDQPYAPINKNEKNRILNYYYQLPQKQFSYEIILSLLNSITDGITKTTFKAPMRTPYVKENKNIKHFFPSLMKEEIIEFFKKLDEIENTNSHITVKGIGRNLFQIEI